MEAKGTAWDGVEVFNPADIGIEHVGDHMTTSWQAVAGPMVVVEQYPGQICNPEHKKMLGGNLGQLKLCADDGKVLAYVSVHRTFSQESCFAIAGIRAVLEKSQDLQAVLESLSAMWPASS